MAMDEPRSTEDILQEAKDIVSRIYRLMERLHAKHIEIAKMDDVEVFKKFHREGLTLHKAWHRWVLAVRTARRAVEAAMGHAGNDHLFLFILSPDRI